MDLLKFATLAGLVLGCSKAPVDNRTSLSKGQDALEQEEAQSPDAAPDVSNPPSGSLSYEEMMRLVSMAPVTLKFEKAGTSLSPEGFVVEYMCEPGLSVTLTDFAKELPSTDACYGVLLQIRLESRSYVPKESFSLLSALFSEGETVTYFSADGRSLVVRSAGVAKSASPDVPRGIFFEIL